MKILLLHPEDSPRRGPWVGQKWDLLVDLGKSSESMASAWQELSDCPVLRLEAFRRRIDDTRLVGSMLRTARGQVVDEQGLDWWELMGLLVHSELETGILLRRLTAEASLAGELFATRDSWMVRGVGMLLGREVRIVERGNRLASIRHYSHLLRTFSASQLTEIFFDKYDGGYRWRRKMTHSRTRGHGPVVLLPSAYTNVSRMAAAYARVLPEQRFLLVATRRSGLQFVRPSNVNVATLAEYAGESYSKRECQALLHTWKVARVRLEQVPELALLGRLGMLEPFPRWFRNGLAVRDAWKSVLAREPVTAVLCGDDSNPYTRLPVILARKHGLPTVDFHHGAFDGRLLMKDLASNVYLAKSEMELDYLLRVCLLPGDRVAVGAPPSAVTGQRKTTLREPADIVFFSEPYESSGGRPDEVYRQLLPALCRVANQHERRVVVKLHPFERVAERSALLDQILVPEQRALINVTGGPISEGLLARTWFGVTVQSSSVADCAEAGIPCFLCAGLMDSPWGYVEQYTRFGMGILLRSVEDVCKIPAILSEPSHTTPNRGLGKPIATETLRQLLAGCQPTVPARAN